MRDDLDMGDEPDKSGDDRPFRDRLFELIGKSGGYPPETLAVLNQCACHVRQRLELEWILRDLGQKYRVVYDDGTPPPNNKDRRKCELSICVERDHDTVASISKEWDQDYFHVSSYDAVPFDSTKDPQNEIGKYCHANNLDLDTCTLENELYYPFCIIYTDKLSKDVLKYALIAIQKCLEMLEQCAKTDS